MKKEEVFLDLSKYTNVGLQRIREVLKKIGDPLSEQSTTFTDNVFNVLHPFLSCVNNEWWEVSNVENKTEITIPQFEALLIENIVHENN